MKSLTLQNITLFYLIWIFIVYLHTVISLPLLKRRRHMFSVEFFLFHFQWKSCEWCFSIFAESFCLKFLNIGWWGYVVVPFSHFIDVTHILGIFWVKNIYFAPIFVDILWVPFLHNRLEFLFFNFKHRLMGIYIYAFWPVYRYHSHFRDFLGEKHCFLPQILWRSFFALNLYIFHNLIAWNFCLKF